MMPNTTADKALFVATLPIPPSNNHYKAHDRRGRVFIPKTTKDYKLLVCRIAKGIMQHKTPSQKRLYGVFDFHFKDNRRRDLDNYLKVLLDSLQGVVFLDDAQFDKIELNRLCPDKAGKVCVLIGEFDA